MHRPAILVLTVAALSVVAIGNASSADRPRPVYKALPAPLPPPMYNWTGFTGGLAYGESKISGSQILPAPITGFSLSDTRVGWTVGAGLGWAFAPQWSAKAEYLYINLDKDPSTAMTPTTTITTGHLTDNIGRVGVNYHS